MSTEVTRLEGGCVIAEALNSFLLEQLIHGLQSISNCSLTEVFINNTLGLMLNSINYHSFNQLLFGRDFCAY